MSSTSQPQALEPSELGTKSHWDAVYTRELANYDANPEDEGTIWFEESGAEERMIDFLSTLEIAGPRDGKSNEEREDIRMLDVGTGNGHILFELRENGWCAELVGVDYSTASIRHAQNIARSKQKEVQHSYKPVEFVLWDVLQDSPPAQLHKKFDVVLDKGTFDAISLCNDVDEQGRKGSEIYSEKVAALLREGGFLLVTSCNWTEDELTAWLERRDGDGERLQFYEAVPFPSIEFGGKRGSSVSCVCFRKSHGDVL